MTKARIWTNPHRDIYLFSHLQVMCGISAGGKSHQIWIWICFYLLSFWLVDSHCNDFSVPFAFWLNVKCIGMHGVTYLLEIQFYISMWCVSMSVDCLGMWWFSTLHWSRWSLPSLVISFVLCFLNTCLVVPVWEGFFTLHVVCLMNVVLIVKEFVSSLTTFN